MNACNAPSHQRIITFLIRRELFGRKGVSIKEGLLYSWHCVISGHLHPINDLNSEVVFNSRVVLRLSSTVLLSGPSLPKPTQCSETYLERPRQGKNHLS